MSTWSLAVVSLLYANAGASYFLKGDWAWGVFWTCYAVANTMFIIATKGAH